ncbi:MAG: OmpA family protein [Polyangiaceae bacterium]|nr:OmpA family protein [Polyangiaceae bacterium]
MTVACASSQKPAVATGQETRQPVAARQAEAPKDGAVAIHVDESIRKACGIQDSKAWFDFDSADLKNKDLPVLNDVAKCFTAGPLKDRKLLLVGHADPRGEFEYNMVLGGERADSVKQYVLDKGMDSQRVSTSSRGEMEAKGTDEPTWAADRRVDVRLAQ